MPLPEVKAKLDDIQLYHDTLESLISGELPFKFDRETRIVMLNQLCVLCWVLGHDGGKEFEDAMKDIIQKLDDAGFRPKAIFDAGN